MRVGRGAPLPGYLRRRRGLLAWSAPVVLAALLAAGVLLGVPLGNLYARAAYDAGDAAEAAGRYGYQKGFTPVVVEPWKAWFNAGTASARDGAYFAAVEDLREAHRLVPPGTTDAHGNPDPATAECRVRTNLSLALEGMGDDSAAAGDLAMAQAYYLEAVDMIGPCTSDGRPPPVPEPEDPAEPQDPAAPPEQPAEPPPGPGEEPSGEPSGPPSDGPPDPPSDRPSGGSPSDAPSADEPSAGPPSPGPGDEPSDQPPTDPPSERPSGPPHGQGETRTGQDRTEQRQQEKAEQAEREQRMRPGVPQPEPAEPGEGEPAPDPRQRELEERNREAERDRQEQEQRSGRGFGGGPNW
ncbi:hypothetical protein [Georgenia sp. AZ-5]|uniref:hypothetical protein n=1 Tax=Georgenia sp. AZ-5 TaxID=3367526 RepID=UPI00375497F5